MVLQVPVASAHSRLSQPSAERLNPKVASQLRTVNNYNVVKSYFAEMGITIADFNGDRLNTNLVLTLPCYDEKLKKFAFGVPLNWYPPFGVTAEAEPVDYW